MTRGHLSSAIPSLSVLAAVVLLGALLAAPTPASAATVTIVNADGAGEGFNDATPASPVGGNPGTTVGAPRSA